MTRNLAQRSVDYLKWRRLLRSCTLDPDELPKPLASPHGSDYFIVGCPRSGTSLVAALLFRPPDSVVCMEPWDGLRAPPVELFASLRQEIADTGRLRRGRLDIDQLDQGVVAWSRDGAASSGLVVSEDYQMAVKWPGFWRYLSLLPDTRFIVCLRHPVEVLQSLERVGGRLSRGLEYDVAFHRSMNEILLRSTDNLAVRRALFYEYVHARILPYLHRANVFTLRYERWASEPEELLSEISSFLGIQPLFMRGVEPVVRPLPDRPDLRELVNEHCPSAAGFGYVL
jgi:hypothetical protein